MYEFHINDFHETQGSSKALWFCVACHATRSRNIEMTGWNEFTPFSTVGVSLGRLSRKSCWLGNFFVSNLNTKFRELSKKSLATDQNIVRQTDGVFFFTL